MEKRTPLYNLHVEQGALMVPFAGWDMPLHYGSQIEEHHQVRNSAGMFDVSHMGVVDIKSTKPQGAQAFLSYLLANDIAKLKEPGKALYTCMLNEKGGVIDDLIVYYLAPDHYRLIVNAGTTQKDLEWMQEQAQKSNTPFSVEITHHPDRAIIAVQGPQAREKVAAAYPELSEKILSLKKFHLFLLNDWMIARTGYTGEDGVEIVLPATKAASLWQTLAKQTIAPIGLGARDTLRLEAGYNLYGQDMDESVSPLESNLDWTVPMETDEGRIFIGRAALEKQKQDGLPQKLIGLILENKGVLRPHQKVWVENNLMGEITSGTFSPTLKQSIAFARVKPNLQNECLVEIRSKLLQARVVQPPFLRR